MGSHHQRPLRRCVGELGEVESSLAEALAEAPDFLLWVEEAEGGPCHQHQKVP